jgi:N-acetyl-gamma-glutamyl-phosphate reductase
MTTTVFIDGESGTTGLQIRTRLEGRSDIQLLHADTEKRKEQTERRRWLNEADIVVLCLPDDGARQAVTMIENPRAKVLDASSAHRVAPGWVYGFPELLPDQADRIREAQRVTNPGCYPTGALALVRPLVDAGLLPKGYPLCVHALSGYTGGGRKMIDAYQAGSHDPVRLYALELTHKHVPEMHLYSGLTHRPLFCPEVGNFAQGMLVQIPLHAVSLPKRASGKEYYRVLSEYYASRRFIEVVPFDISPIPHLAPEALNGTNRMELFVFEGASDGHLLLVARLDNLGKGASGAAVQNIDLMIGLESKSDYALPAGTQSR